ncbi:arsenate reductase family protein [uncultured Fusobacterium sp.]|uniref:arsenate reductase family protein n=1 Tax=uncultured Fusobacterium sp. TaxID=159267 RepID=UPI0025DFA9C6|nr:arsenate reductase family protein [uncultured Fusobacterium sp.]
MIQIFGKKNCNESKKAERFFKERGIKVQFINLKEKAPSKGELKSITAKYPLEELIDVDGTEYKNRNLQYMVFDLEETLLENPILFKSPILRNKNEVILGYDPEILKRWAELEK